MNIHTLQRTSTRKRSSRCSSPLHLFKTRRKRKRTVSSHHSSLFVACPIGSFKSTISNDHRCEPCPLNSFTRDKGAASCLCQDGFFRLNASLFHSGCIGNQRDIHKNLVGHRLFCCSCASLGSPTEPQNVTVEEIDQASVKISWKQSIDKSHDLVYRVECHRLIEGRTVPCESYITYQPNRTLINGTR